MHVMCMVPKAFKQHPVVIKSPAHKAGLFFWYNTNMKLVTRQQAIEQKLTRYFTGEQCKHSHIAERLLSNRTCIECQLSRKLEWSNRPDVKAKGLIRLNVYDKANPATKLARTRKRQAQQLQRTPPWDPDAHLIVAKYQLAAMLSQAAGIPHHVDHIIPLQGRKVSGLHVFSNLRVIPGSDNVKKSNKFHI